MNELVYYLHGMFQPYFCKGKGSAHEFQKSKMNLCISSVWVFHLELDFRGEYRWNLPYYL